MIAWPLPWSCFLKHFIRIHLHCSRAHTYSAHIASAHMIMILLFCPKVFAEISSKLARSHAMYNFSGRSLQPVWRLKTETVGVLIPCVSGVSSVGQPVWSYGSEYCSSHLAAVQSQSGRLTISASTGSDNGIDDRHADFLLTAIYSFSIRHCNVIAFVAASYSVCAHV